jgi:hypothetical protein
VENISGNYPMVRQATYGVVKWRRNGEFVYMAWAQSYSRVIRTMPCSSYTDAKLELESRASSIAWVLSFFDGEVEV